MANRANEPHDDELLTDTDVDYAPFHCCGDEDLVFLRCPQCGHIWVECYECSTWYVDLNDLSRRESSFSTDENERLACPSCRSRFQVFSYLQRGNAERHLPTAEEVVAAGFERYLAPHRRDRKAP